MADSVMTESFAAGVDIASKALKYAFWHSDRRASEIKDALRIVVGNEIVAAAVAQITGEPPADEPTLPPAPTRDELREANHQALADIAAFVAGKLESE